MKRVPGVSQAVARADPVRGHGANAGELAGPRRGHVRGPVGSVFLANVPMVLVCLAGAIAFVPRLRWLVDAANHAFLQAMYTFSIWATLLSQIGVAFVLRCFRSDR